MKRRIYQNTLRTEKILDRGNGLRASLGSLRAANMKLRSNAIKEKKKGRKVRKTKKAGIYLKHYYCIRLSG